MGGFHASGRGKSTNALASPKLERRTSKIRDDHRPLLVFFWHERSGPARRMDSLVAHVARKERARLRVLRVNIADHPDLATRFRVHDAPALVVVKERRVVARIDGRVSAPRIDEMLEPFLESVPA